MGHKKKRKFGIDQKWTGSKTLQPAPGQVHEGFLSTRTKALLGVLAIIIIAGLAYWQLTSQTASTPLTSSGSSQQYPQLVSGSLYSTPEVSQDGISTSIPTKIVRDNRLTFVDLKLQQPLNRFPYQDRTIPLGMYKGGQYLPLLIISTPTGKVLSGIRVCEPCGSFSFHIVDAKYLDCDTCHTKWDIETLTGISGGCPNFPPPKLPTSTSTVITIDLSALGMQITS